MLVDVREYDPTWPSQFETIKSELERTLHNVPHLGIEHVGSTSIVGMCAKPVIDIDIGQSYSCSHH